MKTKKKKDPRYIYSWGGYRYYREFDKLSRRGKAAVEEIQAIREEVIGKRVKLIDVDPPHNTGTIIDYCPETEEVEVLFDGLEKDGPRGVELYDLEPEDVGAAEEQCPA